MALVVLVVGMLVIIVDRDLLITKRFPAAGNGSGDVDLKRKNQTTAFKNSRAPSSGVLALNINNNDTISSKVYFGGLFRSNISVPDLDGVEYYYDYYNMNTNTNNNNNNNNSHPGDWRSYDDKSGGVVVHTAICELDATGWYNFMFHPHFLQLLLRCWSFFEIERQKTIQHNNNNNNKNIKRILSIPDKYRQFIDGKINNRFIQELRLVLKLSGIQLLPKSVMEESYFVQGIMTLNNNNNNNNSSNSFQQQQQPSVSLAKVIQFDKRSFWMETPAHAQSLRRRLLESCSIVVVEQTKDTTTSSSSSLPLPRIGILNRQHTRTLLHADEIAQAIETELELFLGTILVDYNSTTQTPPPVKVTYFETASLCDQVRFFASMDIIISPHGAQLSGLFLMPPIHDAGATAIIMEVFPLGFVIPWYFGSLASSSGIEHTFLYETRGDVEAEVEDALSTTERQSEAKDRDLDIPISLVVKSIRKLVTAWMTMKTTTTASDCIKEQQDVHHISFSRDIGVSNTTNDNSTNRSSSSSVWSAIPAPPMLPTTDWMQ